MIKYLLYSLIQNITTGNSMEIILLLSVILLVVISTTINILHYCLLNNKFNSFNERLNLHEISLDEISRLSEHVNDSIFRQDSYKNRILDAIKELKDPIKPMKPNNWASFTKSIQEKVDV